MAVDAAKASAKAKDKVMEKLVKDHIANQLDALDKPHRAKRRRKKDGFVLN